jgi:hypothetical protein
MLKEVTIIDRLKIRLTGSAYIGNHKKYGWKESLPFYAFLCREHGIVKNYSKGYTKRLECPLCIQNMRKTIYIQGQSILETPLPAYLFT